MPTQLVGKSCSNSRERLRSVPVAVAAASAKLASGSQSLYFGCFGLQRKLYITSFQDGSQASFVMQVDIYTPLKSILAKAWVLWELTLLAEPLMVVACSPGEPLGAPLQHLLLTMSMVDAGCQTAGLGADAATLYLVRCCQPMGRTSFECQTLAVQMMFQQPLLQWTGQYASSLRCAGDASAAVAALISMISPLPYSADFRPYFTIHDEDFGALAAGQLPDNSNTLPRLLGVTNLYFLKVSKS